VRRRARHRQLAGPSDELDEHIKQLIGEVLHVQGRTGLVTHPRRRHLAPTDMYRRSRKQRAAADSESKQRAMILAVEQLAEVDDGPANDDVIRVVRDEHRRQSGGRFVGRPSVGDDHESTM